MEQEKSLNIRDYLAIGLRRKWWIILPFIASVFISYGVYKYLPKEYKSTTLILVQPQRVPETYVRPTVTDSIIDRLNTLSQEILSRTRLEKVILDFNLYENMRKSLPMEVIVESMRAKIKVEVSRRAPRDPAQNTFSISYEGNDPRTVMLVTNRLASLIIEENLRVREAQAESTSDFLSVELQKIEGGLVKKEQSIKNFRQSFMGQLPQQLDANLRILEQLRQQAKTTNERMRAAEDRSIVLQTQLEQLKASEIPATPTVPTGEGERSQETGRPAGSPERGPEDPIITQFNQLKRDLTVAQSKYTENHPDVIELKRKISNIEPKVKDIAAQQAAATETPQRDGVARRPSSPSASGSGSPPSRVDLSVVERLRAQYQEQLNAALLEAKRLKEEEKKTIDQIQAYQNRIEETPKREQELSSLTRDYDLLKTNYQSLMEKKIQAQLAENLERKQQGEQFKILDPARLPEAPIKPQIINIMLPGVFLGFLFGLGLAILRETWHQTFHTEAEVEQALGIPVIAVIPNLKENKDTARA